MEVFHFYYLYVCKQVKFMHFLCNWNISGSVIRTGISESIQVARVFKLVSKHSFMFCLILITIPFSKNKYYSAEPKLSAFKLNLWLYFCPAISKLTNSTLSHGPLKNKIIMFLLSLLFHYFVVFPQNEKGHDKHFISLSF